MLALLYCCTVSPVLRGERRGRPEPARRRLRAVLQARVHAEFHWRQGIVSAHH